jgi:Protein of unknown function (DUF2934)
MSFLYQQLNSFLNLGICKEYPSMAKSKSPAGSKKNPVPNGPASIQAAESGVTQAESTQPETRRVLGMAKVDSRSNVVPINLEDEIRRRAYELAEQRGFSAGHETEDWLTAESEVLQRYRQQTA